MRVRTRLIAVAVALVAAVAAIVVTLAFVQHDDARKPETPARTEPTETATPETYVAPSAEEITALPEAAATMEYTIGELIPFEDGPIVDQVYHLTADAPVYGEDRDRPVARLDAENFLLEPTTVVVSRFDGDWALVLTPARIDLPSTTGTGSAPAQSSGWVRRDLLTVAHAQTHRVIVNTAERTATIQTWSGETISTFPVGVGGTDNPSPTGTTYIQARYLDPAQDQTEHRIQLMGAYSSVQDAPWLGSAHIGVHYSAEPDADSHGCVRMTAEGIEAIDALPLGTVVTFVAG